MLRGRKVHWICRHRTPYIAAARAEGVGTVKPTCEVTMAAAKKKAPAKKAAKKGKKK
jgi:hypothetical protein